MSFQPLSQTVTSGKTQEIPSSDAVYNAIATGVGTAFPYYGSFYDTTIQNNLVADAVNIMSYNTTAENYHVTIQNNNRITFEYPGVYNIQFSAQLEKTGGQASVVNIWLRKNGNDVAWSDTEITLANASRQVASWNFVISEVANDYIQICWASSDTNVRVFSQAATINPPRPAIPSVILTVTPVKAP